MDPREQLPEQDDRQQADQPLDEQREQAMKVYAAINAVAAGLAVEGIGKDRDNKMQGFKFRGIDDMYNAIAPLLAKHKLCILPAFAEREVIERQSAKGGVLIYVNVAGKFTFVSAEDGSSHTVGPFYGEAMDSGDKATNKAQSAAYKYMCMQTFCIPTEGDNDADATTHVVAAKPKGDSARQVAVDAFESMSAEQKDYLHGQAMKILELFESKQAMLNYIDGQRFDTEDKLAIWSLLPANVRAAIKVEQAADRATKKPVLTPADYASQA